MLPDNRRRDKDHDDWRECMRLVYRLHPTLRFMSTLGNDLVCFGGYVHDNPQAVNDNTRQPRP